MHYRIVCFVCIIVCTIIVCAIVNCNPLYSFSAKDNYSIALFQLCCCNCIVNRTAAMLSFLIVHCSWIKLYTGFLSWSHDIATNVYTFNWYVSHTMQGRVYIIYMETGVNNIWRLLYKPSLGPTPPFVYVYISYCIQCVCVRAQCCTSACGQRVDGSIDHREL